MQEFIYEAIALVDSIRAISLNGPAVVCHHTLILFSLITLFHCLGVLARHLIDSLVFKESIRVIVHEMEFDTHVTFKIMKSLQHISYESFITVSHFITEKVLYYRHK